MEDHSEYDQGILSDALARISWRGHIERMTSIAVALGCDVNMVTGSTGKSSNMRRRMRIGRVARRLSNEIGLRPVTLQTN